MKYAQVIVEYIKEPTGNQISAGLKCNDGQWYNIPNEFMSRIQKGEEYEFGYQDREWNGRYFHDIKMLDGNELKRGTGDRTAREAVQEARERQNGSGHQTTRQPQNRAQGAEKAADTIPTVEQQFLKECVHLIGPGDSQAQIEETLVRLGRAWQGANKKLAQPADLNDDVPFDLP